MTTLSADAERLLSEFSTKPVVKADRVRVIRESFTTSRSWPNNSIGQPACPQTLPPYSRVCYPGRRR